MKNVLVLALACAIVGCTPARLAKPGAGPDDYKADLSSCENDAGKDVGTVNPLMRMVVGAGAEQIIRQRDVRVACMKLKGWGKS